jgi:hypothetical protein
MPFVPVADTVLLEMRMALYGQKIENTLYFRKTGGVGVSDATTLMNDMLIWWTTLLSPALSRDLTLREMTTTDLSTSSGFSVTQAAPTPNPAGGQAFDGLPGNVAICVSFRTPNRGRSFRGRNYVPGLAEPDVTGNTLSPGRTNEILDAYQGVPFSVTGSGFEWVVVSRFSGGVPRTAGIATAISSVVIVDSFVDSQRRRLTGRGQ